MPEREVLEIIVPGEPVPKARPRVTRNGRHTYTPERTRKAQYAIGWKILEAYPGLVPDRESRFSVTLHFATASLAKDGDNLAKLALDGMLGVVFGDDNQVDHLEVTVERLYGLRADKRARAHTRIRIEPI